MRGTNYRPHAGGSVKEYLTDLGAALYNIQTGGCPCYDADRKCLFVVPKTGKRFMGNKKARRVMLDNPISLREFKEKALALLEKRPFKNFGIVAHYYLENSREYIESTMLWGTDTYLYGNSDDIYVDGFIFEWK